MNNVTKLGTDLAKSVFQLHGVDAEGQVLLRRQLKRSQMLPFFQRLPPALQDRHRSLRQRTVLGA